MGTDIHGVFQRHNPTTGNWEDIPSNYEQQRHYQLFAVLAGVRNGTGFAGIKTGEPVTPISVPRGYPEDFSVEDDDHIVGHLEHIDPGRRKYRIGKWLEPGENPLKLWMGDHNHSWLTAEEMLAWYESAPTVIQTGILDRAVYESWDKKSAPDSYCGGISGPSVVLINDNHRERESRPDWTHIRCEWDQSLRGELAYFFDEVARLQVEHGRVRFVFGFDS